MIKIYFPLQKQLGYAKNISSVSSLLLNSDVPKTKNNCTEREFWEMRRMKASLSDPRSGLFQSALKERMQILGDNFFVTLLLKHNSDFFFFFSCCIFLQVTLE